MSVISLKSEYSKACGQRDQLWSDWQEMVDEWNRTQNYAAKEIGYRICQEAEKRCHDLYDLMNGCKHENTIEYAIQQILDGDLIQNEREVCFDCGKVLSSQLADIEIPF